MEAQLVREPEVMETVPSQGSRYGSLIALAEVARETARNILLQRAIELATQAIEADDCDNLEGAFELYTDAIQLFTLLVKSIASSSWWREHIVNVAVIVCSPFLFR